MDSLDLKILSCLKNNARAKASQISEEVNLSVSAVTERIKKLEASGVICGYTVVLDQKKLGNDVIALMEVSLVHPRYYDRFTGACRAESEYRFLLLHDRGLRFYAEDHYGFLGQP